MTKGLSDPKLCFRASDSSAFLLRCWGLSLYKFVNAQDHREWGGGSQCIYQGSRGHQGPANINYLVFLCLHFSSGTFLGSWGGAFSALLTRKRTFPSKYLFNNL